MLDAVVNAASHAFTATTHGEIAAKVRVYAQNPSLAEARGILDQRHVLIISGPPGVGKTTLAEILAFAYIGDGWDLIAIRSLEDGFARIKDTRKQIFFFDDFLGTIALDRRALAANDSALSLFMNRIRKSPNARFILTTRAYILNEARSVSERLADGRVDISTYVLDMGSYTRAIRARILYNHLVVSETPAAHVRALIDSGKIARIVDHPNYNPRIIEWMTDALRIEAIKPKDYAKSFLAVLDNPAKLWDTAFRTHITPACRHLLVALFFTEAFGVSISALRATFDKLHATLCQIYGIAQDPKDFESSLRHLEGGFVEISDDDVNFINPSVRDYLASYLEDGELLPAIAASVTTGRAARSVWHFAAQKLLTPQRLAQIAAGFVPLIETLKAAPHWHAKPDSGWDSVDIDNPGRIELLLDWWSATGDHRFVQGALAIVDVPPQGFSSWRDGVELVELVRKVDDEGYVVPFPEASLLKQKLEMAVRNLLARGVGSEELEKISDAVEAGYGFSAELLNAVRYAIIAEVDTVNEACSDMDSESTLSDHAEALKRLAPRAGVPPEVLASAISSVEDRMAELSETTSRASEPMTLPQIPPPAEQFDDKALLALFGSLRR